jgi:hypothetical protein
MWPLYSSCKSIEVHVGRYKPADERIFEVIFAKPYCTLGLFAEHIKKKNTRDLYRGIKEWKNRYQLRNNLVKIRTINCL